jgi:hypothetical protein
MKKCFFVFILALSLFSLNPAEAFDIKGLQPVAPYGVFSTFSADSLKQNNLGVNLELERSQSPDFYRTTLKGAYGLHDRFEVLFSLPYVSGHKNWDGMEDVSVGVKHRIIDETDYSPAFAYLLVAAAPVENQNISTNGRVGGGAIFTKKVGPFKGHLNFFYFRPEQDGLHNEADMNVGTELAITHNSTILAEMVAKKDFFRDKNRLNLLEWRFGYRVANSNNVFTTIGGGFDTKNRTPELRLLFSVSVILPFQHPKIQKVYEE